MLRINATTAVPEHETWFEFSHASGPGGQNVNKVESEATLCFAVEASGALLPWQKERVRRALRNRIGKDGVLRIRAGNHRTQAANRNEAQGRFCALLKEALAPRKRRVATRPTRASRERRLREKHRRAETKRRRQRPDAEE